MAPLVPPRFYLPLLDRLLAGRISRYALDGAEGAHRRGDNAAALKMLAAAAACAPRNATLLARTAFLYRTLGNPISADQACRRALELEPMHDLGLMLSSYLDMPGPDYMELLQRVQATLRPRTYIEIGVETGASIRLAGPGTRAIGVDPAPQVEDELPPNITIVSTTSDEFFASYDLDGWLGGLPIELAFIDGMHHFEYALRDLINLERRCTAESTILVHDGYPLNRATAERERRTNFWSGDIWRLIVALRKFRPDLKVNTIATPPTGLAVVRGLNPSSRVLSERYETIVSEMLALDYAAIEHAKPAMLNRFPNEWERIAALLSA
ncbi:MAG TPA: class I SAM-dependent methyltransferase [Burkholderiales bacterium]|nr:class I SAM-dependent methyltransferase [Burkholderiales bacterium]